MASVAEFAQMRRATAVMIAVWVRQLHLASARRIQVQNLQFTGRFAGRQASERIRVSHRIRA